MYDLGIFFVSRKNVLVLFNALSLTRTYMYVLFLKWVWMSEWGWIAAHKSAAILLFGDWV